MAYGLLNVTSNDLLDCMLQHDKHERSSSSSGGGSSSSSSLPYSFKCRASRPTSKIADVKCSRGGRLPEHAVRRRQSAIGDEVSGVQPRPPVRHGRSDPGRPPGLPDVSSSAIVRLPASSGGGGGDGGGQDCDQHGIICGRSCESDAAMTISAGSHLEYLYGEHYSISVLERLILTHPVWFLRGIYRTGAVHLLQGKEVGNFIIRQSSQPSTMAITVRLPDDKGPYVEHYLVEAIGNNKLRLEGSDVHFSAIPLLVAHYCQCCDELPVQLTLPKSIMAALTKQELTSMAHLGQEFWVSPLSMTPTKNSPSPKKQLMPVPLSTSAQVRPQMITFASPVSPSPPAASMSTISEHSALDSSLTVKGLPPVPPPRWYSISPPPAGASTTPANFTVTTTVTFHVNQCTAVLPVKVSSEDPYPSSKQPCEVIPQPILTTTTIASLSRRKRRFSQPVSLPTVPCIDSPPGYHCSSVTDKASDYEDIWLQTPSPVTQCEGETNVQSSDEMQVVRALKALGLASHAWNYATGEANQTDQEKVLARNSQNQMDSPETGAKLELEDKESDETTTTSPLPPGQGQSEPVKIQSPFYAEPLDSLDEAACSTPKSKQRSASKNISTSLTDLHLVGGVNGGLLNGGFRSSSSQLETKEGTRSCDDALATADNSVMVTLPRAAAKVPKKASLLQQFAEFPFDVYINSAATTLTKRNLNNSDGKDTLWKLDSSWEWYSRHCRGSMPSSTDSSEGEVYAVENLDNDNDVDASDDELQQQDQDDEDDANKVHLRNYSKSSESPFPHVRPLGGYMSGSSSNGNQTTTVTVEELLTQKQPQLKVPEIKPLTARNLLRVSEYENLDDDDDDDDDHHHHVEVATPSIPNLAGCPRPPKKVTTFVKLPKFEKIPDVELRAAGTRLLQDVSQQRHPHQHLSVKRKVPSETGSSATEFSEPWDSSRWEQLLMEAASMGTRPATLVQQESSDKIENAPSLKEAVECGVEETRKSVQEMELLAALDGLETDSQSTSTLHDGSLDNIDEQMEAMLQNIPALPCLLSLRRKDRHLGRPIRDYVLKMACDTKLIFGQHIENFIQCTLESHETDPHITMRNMRQFMSGMANFLVNSGEGQFSHLVQEERAKLKSNEFLNLDTILEGVLHRIVVRPLKRHLCQLFVREYTSNGAVSALSDGIKFARARCADQLGLKSDLRPLQGSDIEAVKRYLVKLQRAYSPLKKLECLLTVISIIYQSILHDRGGLPQSVGADDFLPMLTYVLVHCGLIAAEIEAEYMWGLLHPSLLSGEGGYYLTTLSSAVHVLKHVQRCHMTATNRGTPLAISDSGIDDNNADGVTLCLSELDGFMKVFVPDEQNGSIISKTIPVRPNMTTRDICKMVAHRLSVSNPQDYALYKLANGEENILSDVTCPWLVKLELISTGVDCVFAYKRTDAKIAWPVHFKKP